MRNQLEVVSSSRSRGGTNICHCCHLNILKKFLTSMSKGFGELGRLSDSPVLLCRGKVNPAVMRLCRKSICSFYSSVVSRSLSLVVFRFHISTCFSLLASFHNLYPNFPINQTFRFLRQHEGTSSGSALLAVGLFASQALASCGHGTSLLRRNVVSSAISQESKVEQ